MEEENDNNETMGADITVPLDTNQSAIPGSATKVIKVGRNLRSSIVLFLFEDLLIMGLLWGL